LQSLASGLPPSASQLPLSSLPRPGPAQFATDEIHSGNGGLRSSATRRKPATWRSGSCSGPFRRRERSIFGSGYGPWEAVLVTARFRTPEKEGGRLKFVNGDVLREAPVLSAGRSGVQCEQGLLRNSACRVHLLCWVHSALASSAPGRSVHCAIGESMSANPYTDSSLGDGYPLSELESAMGRRLAGCQFMEPRFAAGIGHTAIFGATNLW
jgi:hypothetical protein